VARKLSPDVAEVLMVLIVLGLAFVGAVAGFIVGRASAEPETTAAITAPAGHIGVGLPAHEFGDPVRGATFFESMGCSMCHSFAGKGGTDAAPLDYMRGHLSAREVANMSGNIWNHLPAMLPRFKEEGIPFPTFTGDQMADLVAYLHSEPGKAAGG